MNKFKLCAGITLVFILGGLVGVLGTGIYFKYRFRWFKEGGPPPIKGFLMERLFNELDLTETQQVEIDKILDQLQIRLHDLWKKHHPEIEKAFDQHFALIKEKLNDEQKQKLDALHEKLKRRGPPGPPPPPFHHPEEMSH